MLNLGGQTAWNCQSQSRRSFMKIGTLGPLGITLADLFRAREAKAYGEESSARSVILLWLWGGPSHLDTFDTKPDAPIEYRGPFASIATSAPGIRVCELLPQLARCADRFALIRTLHHDETDHGVAGTIGLTGSKAGGIDLGGASRSGPTRPSIGAIAGRLRQREAGTLPPYVILGERLQQGRKLVVGEGGGALGSAHDPFRLRYQQGAGLKLPDLELPGDVTGARLDTRWELLSKLDGARAPIAVAGQGERLDRHYELARTLIGSPRSMAALDVSREPKKVRERYGMHRFGQCCLIARRLVEAGIPFTQVNWSSAVEPIEDNGDGGWDMHDRYFAIMQDQHGWMFDRAASALIEDLDHRGLLATTMVVAVGEFGRSPKINNKAGREHHSQCYSALVAGGGVQGGRVVGQTDRRGERPDGQAFTPADLGATILSRLGINTTQLTGLNLTPSGEPIEDLF